MVSFDRLVNDFGSAAIEVLSIHLRGHTTTSHKRIRSRAATHPSRSHVGTEEPMPHPLVQLPADAQKFEL